MIAIVDYGVGNLFSLSASLAFLGQESVVTRDAAVLARAQRIILPGVGAFGDAVDKLRRTGMYEPVRALAKNGKPLLGICLGMQLLFEKGFEYGEHEGLGLIEGTVEPLSGFVSPGMKVPQMGWNGLDILKKDDPLVRGIKDGDCVYFVHSFFARHCDASLVATAEYGVQVPAIVRRGNVCGTQFHPEKSGKTGLSILRAFAEDAL